MTWSQVMQDSVAAGLLNFRDLGGLVTADGRAVRSHLLFRSDDIGALSDSEWEDMYVELGIVTGIDLRSGFEDSIVGGTRTESNGPSIHCVPILDGSMAELEIDELTLSRIYNSITFDSAAALVTAVRLMASPGALPAIAFCTAGKDRTGVLIAVLLNALGVMRAEVVDDYVLSASASAALRTRFTERFKGAELPAVPDEMFEAPESAILTVLDEVDERFGSARRFLIEHGLEPAALDDLAAVLLGGQNDLPECW